MTPMVLVRPKTRPAMISGDGLQPFVGAVVLLEGDTLNPCSSAYSAISMPAL